MNEQLILQFLLMVIGFTLLMALVMPGDDKLGLFGLFRTVWGGSLALLLGILFFWRAKPPSLIKLGLTGALISWMIHTRFPVDVARVLPQGTISAIPIVNTLVPQARPAEVSAKAPAALAAPAAQALTAPVRSGAYRVRCLPPFDGLHLRSVPNGSILQTMPCNYPVDVTGSGVQDQGLVWLPVAYNGQRGWSVQGYLEPTAKDVVR
jgi:hypothetical protein